MRNYTAPFGYKYDMGKIVVDPHDCAVVKYIFELGSQGISLSRIGSLVAEKYSGIVFNKCKVSRILKDTRYLGQGIYERIIEETLFNKVTDMQNGSSTKKSGYERAEVLRIKVPVACPLCHLKMRRLHDTRNKCTERWKCMNPECNCSIDYADDDMIGELRAIVSNLKNLRIECHEDTVRRSIETARLESDIKAKLQSELFDIEQLRGEIIDLASRKYIDITDIGANQQRIADDIKFSDIADNYIEFINNNALSIDIESDRSITIVLKDGTKHRRTSTYGNSVVREREESNTYSSNQKFG